VVTAELYSLFSLFVFFHFQLGQCR